MMGVMMRWYRRLGGTLAHRTLPTVVFVICLFAYSTTGFMYFELPKNPDLTWLDSAWWSIVTMTTVGYGDFFPETAMGRLLVGIPTMIFGVGILGYILSILSGLIMESRVRELRGMSNVRAKNHIVVIHYNGLGNTQKLVDEIHRDPSTRDVPIVLVDEHLDELPSVLHDLRVLYVRGNPARSNALERANIKDAQHVLIQADLSDPGHSDTENLAVALTVERLYPAIHTVVQCLDPANEVFFERAGVDGVVCVDSLACQLMVQELQDPGVNDIVTELTTNALGKQFYVVEIPESINNYGQAVDKYSVPDRLVIGLYRGQESILLPESETPVEPGDRLVLIASSRPS